MKKTGKVFIYRQGPASVSGRLYNFAVGKADLKHEHEQWLLFNVRPLLNAGGSLTVIGLTSRTDTPEFNQALSVRRTESIVRYLRTHSRTNFKVAIQSGMGELAAQYAGVRDGIENENWRAVVLHAWNFPNPPPPPAPPLPKRISTVERRVATSFLATYQVNDRGATAGDGAGPKIANAEMAIMHERNLRRGGYQPVHEWKGEVLERDNKVVLITVKASSSSTELLVGGVDQNYCHVQYNWHHEYPSKEPILLYHYHRRGALSNEPPRAFRLSKEGADLWLHDPPKAWAQQARGQQVDYKTVIRQAIAAGI